MQNEKPDTKDTTTFEVADHIMDVDLWRHMVFMFPCYLKVEAHRGNPHMKSQFINGESPSAIMGDFKDEVQTQTHLFLIR